MRALWDASALRIAERGGQVLERGEHDLLAVWGVDATREDDAEQAVLAALALLATLRDQAWAVLAEDESDESLPIKVGIHSGVAVHLHLKDLHADHRERNAIDQDLFADRFLLDPFCFGALLEPELFVLRLVREEAFG